MNIATAAITTFLISCCLHAQAAKTDVTAILRGTVVQVDDGDTVVVLQPGAGRTVVRLTDIDAPEVRHGKSRPGQPFGQTAKRKLESLVLGRPVQAECFDQTTYDRQVCRIRVDGLDAGAQLVELGLAWVPDQSRYVRDGSVHGLQAQARRARVGVWSQVRPVAPWVWRKQCWASKQCVGEADE